MKKNKRGNGSDELKTVNGSSLWMMMNSPHNLQVKDDKGNVARQQVPVTEIQLATPLTLASSLEPHGGSPTEQPTAPVLHIGKISQL